MKISIITVSFNSDANILTAVKSVNDQTYPFIEHVFIDGKSNDNTIQLIKQNSTRENFLLSEKDNGIYEALNKGISNAKGDIIGFLHSDDFFATDHIITDVVRHFDDNHIDGIYGDLQYVDKLDVKKIIRNWKSMPFKHSLLNLGWMPPHPTLFLRKQVYENYGCFNLSYKIASDYEFILRIFKQKKLRFKYVPTVITKMRTGGVSNKSVGNLYLKSQEDMRAIKTHNLKYPFLTLTNKNLSKLNQFF